MAKRKRHKYKGGLDLLAQKHGYSSYSAYCASDYWKSFKASYTRAGLPLHCIACESNNYELHHLRYNTFQKETFGDVIPLCGQCHNNLHRFLRKQKLPNSQTRVALQRLFKWTDEETVRRFEAFEPYWEQVEIAETRRRQQNTEKMLEKYPRHSNDYYKVSKDLVNLRRYVQEGYTVKDLARMYQVPEKYIQQYMSKYPENFM